MLIGISGRCSFIKSLSTACICSELLFLKKASQSEEDAGTSDLVATTPLVNKTTFIKRVIGVDSVNYLATAIRNGLYPKEHFAIVSGIGAPIERNYGTINGYEPNSVPIGTMLPVTGNIVSAQYVTSLSDGDVILCTVATPMDNTDFEVDITVQSLGSYDSDNNLRSILWKPISTTTFSIFVGEVTPPNTQSLKIHLTVKQR